MTTIPAEKLDKLVARWEAIQGELASGASGSGRGGGAGEEGIT